MRRSSSLLFSGVMRVMAVFPTHTTFGFFGSRFLVMAVLPASALGLRGGLRAFAAVLRSLLFFLHAFLFAGYSRVWNDAETRRQSLFAPLFLAFFYRKVDVVGVFQRPLVGPSLFPESALVKALTFADLFHEIGVDARTEFFDLGLGALQGTSVSKGQLLQVVEACDELIDVLVP